MPARNVAPTADLDGLEVTSADLDRLANALVELLAAAWRRRRAEQEGAAAGHQPAAARSTMESSGAHHNDAQPQPQV